IMDAALHLVRAAMASGDIRGDLEADDLRRLLTGLSQGYDQPGWEASARRLIDILVAGLRPT
ncbi:MAG TPA: hypothetical protein VG798_00190, partial [Rhizomicrobium sp.]|nr:hypothetical protein [Rhizomicrobium sp.]